MNERCHTLFHLLTDFNRRSFLSRVEITPCFGCSVDLAPAGVCNGVNGTPLASLHTQRVRELRYY